MQKSTTSWFDGSTNLERYRLQLGLVYDDDAIWRSRQKVDPPPQPPTPQLVDRLEEALLAPTLTGRARWDWHDHRRGTI